MNQQNLNTIRAGAREAMRATAHAVPGQTHNGEILYLIHALASSVDVLASIAQAQQRDIAHLLGAMR